jgi:hypothetical protein
MPRTRNKLCFESPSHPQLLILAACYGDCHWLQHSQRLTHRSRRRYNTHIKIVSCLDSRNASSPPDGWGFRWHTHTHTHTHTRTVELRTSDKPVAATSAWLHITQETDMHVPSWIRNGNSRKRTTADPRLKPRCHRDRHNTIHFHGATAASGPRPANYRGSMITFRHTTVDRTPLDEWSARRRNLYLTTHKTKDRYACPWRDSKPQSQQASGRRPTP